MQKGIATRFYALVESFGLRLAMVLLGFIGYSTGALAINQCTPWTPASYFTVTPGSTTYPGAATIQVNAAVTPTGGCVYTLMGYSIYVNGALASTVSPYVLSNLSAGTYSIYTQSTYSTAGTFTSSTYTLTITPAAQTITFTTPPQQTYGVGSYALAAHSTSGLAITYTTPANSTCSISGSSAIIANAGTCTITASQSGTSNYTAASSVSQVLTVNKAPQTITFAQLPPQTLGAAPFTVTASSPSNSGVIFSSASPTICTVSGSTVKMVASGNCTIDANVSTTANYLAASQIANTFMVNIAPTISVTGPGDGTAFTPLSPLTFTAGETPGTYTISNVTYYDTASGTALCTATTTPWSCTDAAGLATGSYAIYAAITTTTSLTVTSLPIAVTVGSGTGAPVSSSTPIPVSITAPSLSNSAAGTLPGNLGVSNNGAATYTMPLALPPGVGGLAPNLSLNYSSQNGNGFLGLGWTLGGMSAIHRCNKTIAQDGVTAGVSFSTVDRLCLDGHEYPSARLTKQMPEPGETRALVAMGLCKKESHEC